MQQNRSQEWFRTPAGEARGYITPESLRELWFHTGTVCNLSCSFCLEGAGPGVGRLDTIRLDDVIPYMETAQALGVERFSFTGGEPFMAPEFSAILEYAAAKRPCLVLTNGTRPLSVALQNIAHLAFANNPVTFRISLDHPDAAMHDAMRGKGNFDRALRNLSALFTMGFGVSVARHSKKEENAQAVHEAYAAVFRSAGLPDNLPVIPFPDFGRPGCSLDVPHISTDCMTRYHTPESRAKFMCAFSKMLVKDAGKMCVYPCTLVDDDAEYDLGGDLASAMSEQVSLKHHRCFSCFAYGASCSEG